MMRPLPISKNITKHNQFGINYSTAAYKQEIEIQVSPQPNSATALEDVTPPELQIQIQIQTSYVTTAKLKAAPVARPALLQLLQPDTDSDMIQ